MNKKALGKKIVDCIHHELNVLTDALDEFLEIRLKEELNIINNKLRIKEAIAYHQKQLNELHDELHREE